MSVTAGQLAGGNSRFNREVNDYYATNPESTLALLSVENFNNSTILEPCAGEGHIVKTLYKHCTNIKVKAFDLVDRGFCKGGIDYLTINLPPNYVDNIITNPPYKYAKEFITKSLYIARYKVCMFLKLQFLEGVNRKDWFKSTPLKYVYVFSKRQTPLKNGVIINPNTNKKWQSTMCFAWFVWYKDYTGEPIIRWL